MEEVKERLRQLNAELGALKTEVKEAWGDYRKEVNPELRAACLKRWERLSDDKKELISLEKLLRGQLATPGVHTLPNPGASPSVHTPKIQRGGGGGPDVGPQRHRGRR